MADKIINNQHDFFKQVVLDENGALKVSSASSAIILLPVNNSGYDITEDDRGKKIVMLYNGDWAVNLPNNLPNNFIFSIIHKEGESNTGTITPFGSTLIDGEFNKKLNGKGEITLIYKDGTWSIGSQITFVSEKDFGRTKYADFTNQTNLTVNHNLGRIPLTEVWVDNGNGYLVQSNVHLEHNWTTKNTFNIEFETQQTGTIIYI